MALVHVEARRMDRRGFVLCPQRLSRFRASVQGTLARRPIRPETLFHSPGVSNLSTIPVFNSRHHRAPIPARCSESVAKRRGGILVCSKLLSRPVAAHLVPGGRRTFLPDPASLAPRFMEAPHRGAESLQ